jgi:hypothetical protein
MVGPLKLCTNDGRLVELVTNGKEMATGLLGR